MFSQRQDSGLANMCPESQTYRFRAASLLRSFRVKGAGAHEQSLEPRRSFWGWLEKPWVSSSRPCLPKPHFPSELFFWPLPLYRKELT